MAYPIKFLSLQKAELEYEVELRGGTSDTVQSLRKQIVKLSLDLPSEDILESHLDPADDLKSVEESLLKSQNNISLLKSKFDKNLFTRTETLLNHIYHRINRINATSEVADYYKVCVSNFDLQYKDLNSLRLQVLQNATVIAAPGASAEPTSITVSCERSLGSDINKLKYSGKTCVRSFILKVEEFIQSRGISYDKIFSLGYEIFIDDALHWFRCNKEKVTSWAELCVLLKQDFSSPDYDYRFAEEIRSRTQGEHENISIYLSIMQGMFSRLSKPFSEAEKLEILMHNIRPCYAYTLAASSPITSVDSLKSVCRNYESIQSNFSQFREPPKATTNTLAPEFAYKSSSFVSKSFVNTNKNTSSNYFHFKNDTAKVNAIESNEIIGGENNVDVVAISSGSPKTFFCPRCRSNGHSLKNCKQERFLICFKCGKKDVRYPECSNCNPNHSKN